MELDSIRLTFGTRVRQLRVLMNMTQADLAFDADLARSYISEIESGARCVSLLTICKLAIALNIQLCDFFNGDFILLFDSCS